MTPISDKYVSLNGINGLLGNPLSNEKAVPDSNGAFQEFQGGSIYWSPQTGAHEVHGSIREKWNQLGRATGFLGYPITDELLVNPAGDRVSHFQHGSIFWSMTFGAHEMHGAILVKWQQLSVETDLWLGVPITDEMTDLDGVGRFNDFQHGSIYWSPEKGAYVVEQYSGAAEVVELAFGDTTGALGQNRVVERLSFEVSNWRTKRSTGIVTLQHWARCSVSRPAQDQTGSAVFDDLVDALVDGPKGKCTVTVTIRLVDGEPFRDVQGIEIHNHWYLLNQNTKAVVFQPAPGRISSVPLRFHTGFLWLIYRLDTAWTIHADFFVNEEDVGLLDPERPGWRQSFVRKANMDAASMPLLKAIRKHLWTQPTQPPTTPINEVQLECEQAGDPLQAQVTNVWLGHAVSVPLLP